MVDSVQAEAFENDVFSEPKFTLPRSIALLSFLHVLVCGRKPSQNDLVSLSHLLYVSHRFEQCYAPTIRPGLTQL